MDFINSYNVSERVFRWCIQLMIDCFAFEVKSRFWSQFKTNDNRSGRLREDIQQYNNRCDPFPSLSSLSQHNTPLVSGYEWNTIKVLETVLQSFVRHKPNHQNTTETTLQIKPLFYTILAILIDKYYETNAILKTTFSELLIKCLVFSDKRSQSLYSQYLIRNISFSL